MKRMLFVSLAAASLLAACNQTQNPASKPMTQQTADGLKLVAPGVVASMVNGIRERGKAGGSSVGARPQGGISGQCAVSANLTDTDKDFIPVSFNASFTDCTVDYVLYFLTKNGTVSVNDTNDNDAKSGFTTKATNLNLTYKKKAAGNAVGNPFLSSNTNWDVALVASSNAYTLNYKFDTALSTYVDGTATVDKTWKLGLGVNGNYTATADGNPDNFDAGVINLNGQISFTDDKNEVYTLNTTLTGLTYTAACVAGPVSGTVKFDDGTAGNFLQVTYTGCNTGTLTYNAQGSTNF
jgi:hypothetical protein